MSTYERPHHLELALTGFLRQEFGDFELVVADDGSGPETAAVVERFAKRAPVPVHHVWQENRGYRRTAVLNQGILKARSDYVVFSDGDCVPAPDLLALHAAHRRPDRILIGGYVRVPSRVAREADPQWVLSGAYEEWLTPPRRRALRRRHLRNRWQILVRRRRRPHNLGLNMSLEREHLLRVNGFDENIVDWGNDDGDLRDRLKIVGVRPLSIWDRAIVYHLNHPVEPTAGERRNLAYVRRPNVPAFAENGIVKRRGD